MSRSRKKRKNTNNKSTGRPRAEEQSAAGNCSALAEKAQAALAAGRHKDAIVAYKSLLKKERRGVWVTGLASAYAARACELACKGMFKEALVIWEQRATSCGTALYTSNHVIWTLLSGDPETAVTLFTQLPDARIAKDERARVSEYFAASALTGESRIVELLPADDPVVRDYGIANALLIAFCADDATALEAQLKAISYRSPYRDFRQIIKAWQIGEHSPGDLPAALSRIAEHSPFRSLANTLLELCSSEQKLMTTAPQEVSTLTLEAAINGWSGKQIDLLKAASSLGPEPNAKALFNLLVRFAAVFEAPVARSAALKILIHYPQGQQSFTRHFGKLSPFEHARLDAQIADVEGDPYEADEAWRDVLDTLEQMQLREPGSDRLREALVLRKLADQWLVFQRNEYPQPQVAKDLERSLTIDPDDVATHIQLIDLQRKNNDLKGARASVKQAVERFPDNTAVLIEAVHTAIEGNAFKKAASIAQQILKIDPINVKVQGILLNAHVAHARKQIKTGKFDLARRELMAAASWARSPEAQGAVKLTGGFLEFSAQETSLGQSLLNEGAALSGGGLVGQYQLLIEAQKLGVQRKNWLKLAALPKANKFAKREHVLALVRAVSNTHGLEDDDIYGSLLEFEGVIRKSISEPYTLAEMELVCETLHRYGLMRLLEQFAQRAHDLWPEQTVFIFHGLYAKANGSVLKLSDSDLNRLDDAIEQAQSDGDSRTVHRIAEFMRPPIPFGFSPGFPPGPPPGFPPELAEGISRDLANLMDEIDPETLASLFEAMDRDLENGIVGMPLNDNSEPAQTRKPRKRDAKRPVPNVNQKDLF